MEQIQIPEGMRDLILDQCRKKRWLQSKIESIFDSYGYQEVMSPTIEFYSTYSNAYQNIIEEDKYKFFDQNGRILTLRSDMTVPIARVCATKFKDIKPPYRFRYTSNVFKVRQKFRGKQSEVTDCGIECIGLKNSDLEVLLCAIDVMESLQCSYTLEIGNVNFFKKASSYFNLSSQKLSDLINSKSMVELKEFLIESKVDKKAYDFFMKLPFLSGDASILDEAYALSFNDEIREVILSLKELNHMLEKMGVHHHITYDLGKVPHYKYYTGIIFEGYVAGVGTSVLNGGRYDHLLEKFTDEYPACGFSVKLDYLLDVIQLESQTKMVIYYPVSRQIEAYMKARELRNEYSCVECKEYDQDEIIIKEEIR